MQDCKVMIVAFHENRVFGYRILPKNTNVNFEIYINFLNEVISPGIKRKRIRSLIILHDNATPHKHKKGEEFFNSHRWKELKHLPYSPDFNPCDFDGTARIKRPNKNKRFANEVQLQAAYEEVIKEINSQNSATGIRHLPLR